jgi:hypothetical protein
MLVRRFLGIWPFDRDVARLAIPTIVGVAVTFAIHSVLPEDPWFLNLIGSGLVGSVVYAVALIGIGLPPRERVRIGRIIGDARRRSGRASSAR